MQSTCHAQIVFFPRTFESIKRNQRIQNASHLNGSVLPSSPAVRFIFPWGGGTKKVLEPFNPGPVAPRHKLFRANPKSFFGEPGSKARSKPQAGRQVMQRYPLQSPYVSIANRQAEIMMRIASEFGFTPASRSRISAPEPRESATLDLFNPRCQSPRSDED